jgi:hypothetical protein
VAMPAHRNDMQKEVEKMLQYKSLGIEKQQMWNLKYYYYYYYYCY